MLEVDKNNGIVARVAVLEARVRLISLVLKGVVALIASSAVAYFLRLI
jgi:hypothetical protein